MTSDPMPPASERGRTNWTSGPAKHAAVAVLLMLIGVAAAAGWHRVPVSTTHGPGASELGLKININTATRAELELLPGIGPAIAQRIVESRINRGTFRNATELGEIRGIGVITLERLRMIVRYE